jgi:hypothetical protein
MPRKEHLYHFIYKTTNLINQKYYIGMHSTNDLNDGYIGSGTNLIRSIKKYGKHNFKFEIIEFLPNRKLLKEKEIEIVNKELLKDSMCLNICTGGDGGYISEEGCKKGGTIAMKKMWENKTFRENSIKKSSERFKENWKNGIFKYVDYWTGRKHREDTKNKIGEKNSKNQKGIKNSQYGTMWITNGIENKKIKKNDIIPIGWNLGRFIKK